ncbi:hypothetical protein [Candidatus Palauibacter sp.]|uniref:hypothetical protein n=1 Tax=Candidatus Palauibacter sp. TaxID=3101350 RepID=UPI003B025971
MMAANAPTAPQNLPHAYSRGVSRVEWKTSVTWSSRSRMTTIPHEMARNQAASASMMMLWSMLWV